MWCTNDERPARQSAAVKDAYRRYSELSAQGRYEEALPFARKALVFREEERGDHHRGIGKVLEHGIGSIRRDAAKRLEALDPIDTAAYVEQRPFLEAVCVVCDAMIAFAHRYAELARRRRSGSSSILAEDRLWAGALSALAVFMMFYF